MEDGIEEILLAQLKEKEKELAKFKEGTKGIIYLATPFQLLSEEPLETRGIFLTEGVWNGDYYPADVIKKIVDEVKNKQIPVLVEHGKSEKFGYRNVGKVKLAEWNDVLKGVVGRIIVEDPEAIELIKKGELRGFSVRGLVDKEKEDGRMAVKDFDLLEISIVKDPACVGSQVLFSKEMLEKADGISLNTPKDNEEIGNKMTEEVKEEVKEPSEVEIELKEGEVLALVKMKREEAEKGKYPYYAYPYPYKGKYPYPYYGYPYPYPEKNSTDIIAKLEELEKAIKKIAQKLEVKLEEETKQEVAEEKKSEEEVKMSAVQTAPAPAEVKSEPTLTTTPATQAVQEAPKEMPKEMPKEESKVVPEVKIEPKIETPKEEPTIDLTKFSPAELLVLESRKKRV